MKCPLSIKCYGQHCHQTTAWCSLENSQEDKILLDYLNWWLFKPVYLTICDWISQTCKFFDHWFTSKFRIKWNTNTKQHWWDNRSSSTGLDDHLAPDSVSSFFMWRNQLFETVSVDYIMTNTRFFSLLAVKFAIKVLSTCGTHWCIRSLSRICSNIGELLIWYWTAQLLSLINMAARLTIWTLSSSMLLSLSVYYLSFMMWLAILQKPFYRSKQHPFVHKFQ